MRLLFFLGFPLNMLGAFWFLLPQPALGWQPRLDLACGLFRLLRRLRRNLRKGQRSQTAWHLHSSAGFAKLDDQHVSWAEQVRAALGFGKHLFRTQANGVRIPVRSLVLRHRFPLKWSGASLFKAKNLRNAQGALNACRPGGPMHRNKHSARRRLGISTSDSNDTAKSTACLIGMGTPKIMIAVQVGKPPPFAWLDNIHKQINHCCAAWTTSSPACQIKLEIRRWSTFCCSGLQTRQAHPAQLALESSFLRKIKLNRKAMDFTITFLFSSWYPESEIQWCL